MFRKDLLSMISSLKTQYTAICIAVYTVLRLLMMDSRSVRHI